MKIVKKFTLLSMCFLILGGLNAATSSKAVKEKPAMSAKDLVEKAFPTDVELTPKQLKKKAKLEKAITKVQKRVDKINAKRALKGKAAIDFSDPVKKWMWFWILGWGAGLILAIVAGIVAAGSVTSGSVSGLGGASLISLLSVLCWLAGTVAGVIWLVKLFG